VLQITVTVSANKNRVMEEAQKLELEGIAQIHEQPLTLTLNDPEQRNEAMVIEILARLARKGFVTEFKSKWIK